MKRVGVGREEPAERLTNMDLPESEGSITVKINRGGFSSMVSDRRYGRYRGIILTIGWLILVAANHPDPEGHGKQAQAQQSIADSLGNISATYHQETQRAHSSEKETEPCQPGDDRRYSDLCAQWKAADAAADSAWWAWAAGLASIISTTAVLVAIGLTYQANAIARDTAKRQLRAYIGVVKATANITEDSIKARIEIKNFGQTPAHGVACATFFGQGFDEIGNCVGNAFLYPSASFFIEKSFLLSNINDVETQGLLKFSGKIEYSDIFGEERHTCFRLNWAGDTQFEADDEGNSAT